MGENFQKFVKNIKHEEVEEEERKKKKIQVYSLEINTTYSKNSTDTFTKSVSVVLCSSGPWNM